MILGTTILHHNDPVVVVVVVLVCTFTFYSGAIKKGACLDYIEISDLGTIYFTCIK
jgi:hypothetical protein